MIQNNCDIRWIQRFSNFQSAIIQLKEGVDIFSSRELNLLEKQGLIQAFEFTHELAWTVLKDFFAYQGNFEIKGSRDAVKEGFKYGILKNGSLWMQMIETRNLTSHTYDKKIIEEIIVLVTTKYLLEFLEFEQTMINIRERAFNDKF